MALALSTVRGNGALNWDNSGCEATIWPKVGGTFSMQRSLQVLERMEVVFDDDNAVTNGGLVLPMSLAGRLGVRELVDGLVDLGDAPGRANVGLNLKKSVDACRRS